MLKIEETSGSNHNFSIFFVDGFRAKFARGEFRSCQFRRKVKEHLVIEDRQRDGQLASAVPVMKCLSATVISHHI